MSFRCPKSAGVYATFPLKTEKSRTTYIVSLIYVNPQIREDYKLQQSLQQEPGLLPVMEVSKVQRHQQKMVDSLPDFEDDSYILEPLMKQLEVKQKERKMVQQVQQRYRNMNNWSYL